MSSLPTIRVGIVSDTHGHLDERIVEILAKCDIAVHAGDIMNGKVLDTMHAACNKLVAVRGNNDIPELWPDGQHRALLALDDEAMFSLPGGDVVVLHGHEHGAMPCHASMRASYPDARLIIYGHSHKLVCDQEQQPWVINPGAAGHTRTHGGPSCLILNASESGWELTEQRFPDIK